MRLHRFIVDTDLSRTAAAVSDPELCHQLGKVLRLTPGDQLILVDGKGAEATCVIESLDAKTLRVKVTEKRPVDTEPSRHVTLCCSILKRENFELVVQKATECGVSEIIPLIAERTVKTGVKMERLRIIAKEAAEQSGRGRIPVIHEPMQFADTLKLDGTKFFFHVGAESPVENQNAEPFVLFIGPEGGWTDTEVALAQSAGCTMTTLGKLILRGETAAIIASFLAVTESPSRPQS